MNQEESNGPASRMPGEFRPKRRLVAALMLTAIFLSGAIVGTGLTVVLKPVLWPRSRLTMADIRDRLTERIAAKLDLTDEQTEQVRRIVEERLTAYAELREEMLPRMKHQGQILHKEVAAVLTDDQVPKWEELYADLSARWFRSFTTTQPASEQAR